MQPFILDMKKHFLFVTKYNVAQLKLRETYCKYQPDEFEKYGLLQYPHTIVFTGMKWERIPFKFIVKDDPYPETPFMCISIAGCTVFDSNGKMTEEGRVRLENIVCSITRQMKVQIKLAFSDKDIVQCNGDGTRENLIYIGPN